MRSTRATSAVERLNNRAGTEPGAPRYSMVRTSSELFYLVQNAGAAAPVKLCEPMALDDFAQFVNAYGPQKPRRVSKLDVAFEKQLGPRAAKAPGNNPQEENND
ncbi:hypothetical protein D9O50_14645 [Oxalobacteraceae bacterium CAVE-383]|nr:hypothetical protein D9O50_14645 [Oxalobacteraceae bacterium CAVE-383]